MYGVDSIIQPCLTQQTKSNVKQQKTHKNISLLYRQTTRQWLKIQSTIRRQKASRISTQTATDNPSTIKIKPTRKDETYIEAVTTSLLALTRVTMHQKIGMSSINSSPFHF